MQSAQESFISSTYWTERIGPAAALATIKKMQKYSVQSHLIDAGKKVQAGWKASASKHGLKIKTSGIYPLSHFDFEFAKPLVIKTLFTQLMLEKGFLASTIFYASYAHKQEHIDRYLKATDEALGKIAGFIEEGDPEKHLKGPVCHSGFKRLN